MNTTKSASDPPSSSKDSEVFIFDDGVAFVFEDDLYELLRPIFKDLTVSRAGHVEPSPRGWDIDVAPACRTLGLPEEPVVSLLRRDEALEVESATVHKLLAEAKALPSR